jgi:glycerol-3-phosphate dehydrogenase
MMAEETIDKAIKSGFLKKSVCITKNLRLGGGKANDSDSRLSIYGSHAEEIAGMILENPETGDQLDQRLPYMVAELRWICRNEMPVTLEDLLARRTRSLILNARASADISGMAARVMAEEMGLSEDWQTEQTELYKITVKNYI